MNQRDVYEVNFPFPDGVFSPHMVVILSVPGVLECEDTFLAVPISSAPGWKHDQFSYPIFERDFERNFTIRLSYTRLHLITPLNRSDITSRKITTMKPEAFRRMWDEIRFEISRSKGLAAGLTILKYKINIYVKKYVLKLPQQNQLKETLLQLFVLG